MNITCPEKTKYYLNIAQAVAKGATCSRLQVGCVIVDSKGLVLSTGYNQAPTGIDNCDHDSTMPCKLTIHAEMNAILCAAKQGVRLRDCHVFITHSPCSVCLKHIIQLEPKSIAFSKLYREGLEHIKNLTSKMKNTKVEINSLYKNGHFIIIFKK